MEDSEILNTIKGIIARITGLEMDEIGDNDSFVNDLELDSLSMMEVWVEIDRAFIDHKVKIPNEELGNIATLGEAVSRIQQELAKV